MNIAIAPALSVSESNLLRYLHDHSPGRGERTSLDPRGVIRGLRVGKPRFDADVTTLSEMGLVGARRFRTEGERVAATDRCAVWITGKGEQFLRLQAFDRGTAAPSAGPRPVAAPVDAHADLR